MASAGSTTTDSECCSTPTACSGPNDLRHRSSELAAPHSDEKGPIDGDGALLSPPEHGAIGVTHSDLHRDHVLVDGNGNFAAVLDFGDAFVRAVAWDFALIAWYYGRRNAQLIADHYPGGNDALERGLILTAAVGAYKLAKNPADRIVIDRLTRCLRPMPTS